jgi:hypothetical protein
MGQLTRLPKAEQWADRVCAQLGKSVDAIIEVGRLLVKAKADLAHGEWGRLFKEELVPFSQNTAGRLMAVAEHPVLTNSAHAQNLPPSWTSLYELTKVETPRLTAAFKDGVITPDMKRQDVIALLPPKSKAESSTEDIEEAVAFDERTDIVKVIHAVRSVVSTWPPDVSLQPLITQLRTEAERLEKRQEKRAS